MKNFRQILIKLSSRKFIIAIIPTIFALSTMLGIDVDTSTTIASSIIAVAAIVSYIATEGVIDAKGIKKKLEEYEDIINNINQWDRKVDEINNRIALQSTTLRDVTTIANIAYSSIPEEYEMSDNIVPYGDGDDIDDMDSLPLQESFDDETLMVTDEVPSQEKIKDNILSKYNDETINNMKAIISSYEKYHNIKRGDS